MFSPGQIKTIRELLEGKTDAELAEIFHEVFETVKNKVAEINFKKNEEKPYQFLIPIDIK